MEERFWQERWAAGQIGFHQASVHDDLLREGERWLGAAPGVVLVPLCGKSLDLAWLEARAEVWGVELVPTAIEAFYAERGLTPVTTAMGAFTAYTASALPRLTMLCGDVLALGSLGARLPRITHVWDRAALVALPREVRALYAATLRRLLPGARLLLNTFDLGPDDGTGPPFSVDSAEIASLYAGCPRAETHRGTVPANAGLRARGVTEVPTITWDLTLRPPEEP